MECMHSKEAIETMDMRRRSCISFEEMEENICILFPLILIPVEDHFYEKKMEGVFFWKKN